MDYPEYKTRRQNLIQSLLHPESRRVLQQILDLLCNTDDLDMLVQVFSTLGIYLLTKNVKYESAIKCNALYNKLNFILKSGLQSKTIIALNFISTLLNINSDNELISMKFLDIYTKNMLRISGCLTSMIELFTSFMMQHDNWKALCKSISDTCDGSVPNQAYCSHLIPLCIQKCKQGNMEPILILQSLLTKHEGNVKLFYDCYGMTIFDRESLRDPACLQLLNLVVENTSPECRDNLSKASDLFDVLRSFLHKYGRNSMVGQWASIILYSRTKVFPCDIIIEEKDKNDFSCEINDNFGTYQTFINATKDANETYELLRNVLREAVDWQSELPNKNKFTHNIFNKDYKNLADLQDIYSYMPKTNKYRKEEFEEQNIFKLPVVNKIENFLLKEKPLVTRYSKQNLTLRSGRQIAKAVQTSPRQLSHREKFQRSIHNNLDETVLDFKPPFFSTPKSNKYSTIKSTYCTSRNSSACAATRDLTIGRKTIDNKSKLINSRLSTKRLDTKSLSAKFLDILNGSCTTLIKGFKSILTVKKPTNWFDDKSKSLATTNVEENNTNLLNKNYSRRTNTQVKTDVSLYPASKDQDWTLFTKEFSVENSSFHSCNTCNDTYVLKYKLENDAFLQQTVKRLKLGINLYGCDFKKISRTMWPREHYMTPNVLYNLYRKLIIQQ